MPNKYLYLYIVQGRYTRKGWEDACQSKNYGLARAGLKACQDSQPKVKHRMIRRRELNPEYTEPLKPVVLDGTFKCPGCRFTEKHLASCPLKPLI